MSLPNRSVRIDPAHTGLLNSVLSLLRTGRVEELHQALALVEQGREPVGLFIHEQAALEFFVSRMVLAARPSAIWLFGSRAGGSHRPDSDFDFLAVFPDDRTAELDGLRHRLADSVMGCGVGVDIAVCTEGDFVRYGSAAGSLIRTVREQGKEVYSRRKRRPAEVSVP